MKNLIKDGDRYYFKGENCWYIRDNGYDFNVYNDGEYKGRYVGTLERLEEAENGSKALDIVFAQL